jgi:EmrB/QacA subfamily drug resistance transporter
MIKDTAQPEQSQQNMGGTPWFVLGVLSIGVILAALDLTVVVAILTSIMDSLDVTIDNIDQGAWIVSAYLLAYTVTMPFMGRVSDVFGRREVFLGALLVFVVGSVVGALATSLPIMIAARSLQALGGGAMVPVSMAVVGDLFPTNKRGMALGIIGAADTAGWVLGPLYGSLMLRYFNWHSIFWINVPLGLISAAIIYFMLKPALKTSRPSSINFGNLWKNIDIPGFLLLALSLTCLSLALGGKDTAAFSGASLEEITKNPLKEYQIPLLIGAAVALLLFVLTELRIDKPLINIRTFLRVPYSAANLANLFIGGALVAALVGIALFVNATDRSNSAIDISFHSALALAPLTLGMALGAVLGGWLSDRLGYRLATILGLVLVSGGFLLMNRWDTHWQPPNDLWNMLPGASVAGLGFGFVIAPVGSAVIDWAEREEIGVAAALVLILRLVGMTLGTSFITTWTLNRYNDLKPKNIDITKIDAQALSLPLAQAVTEVFLGAAALAALAIFPALLLSRRKLSSQEEQSRHEISHLL